MHIFKETSESNELSESFILLRGSLIAISECESASVKKCLNILVLASLLPTSVVLGCMKHMLNVESTYI